MSLFTTLEDWWLFLFVLLIKPLLPVLSTKSIALKNP